MKEEKGQEKRSRMDLYLCKGKQKERRKMMEIKMNKINTKILSE